MTSTEMLRKEAMPQPELPEAVRNIAANLGQEVQEFLEREMAGIAPSELLGKFSFLNHPEVGDMIVCYLNALFHHEVPYAARHGAIEAVMFGAPLQAYKNARESIRGGIAGESDFDKRRRELAILVEEARWSKVDEELDTYKEIAQQQHDTIRAAYARDGLIPPSEQEQEGV